MDLRLHHRLSLVVAAGALLVSCQTLSGSGGSSKEFTQLKQAVTEDRARLRDAVSETTPERAGQVLNTLSGRFDEIWAKSPGMNLLDREHLAIQLASGRRIVGTAKQWVATSDIEAVRAEVTRLDEVLGEIEVLLDRASRGTEESAPAGS